MQAPAACSVRSQSAACPTSPPIDFLIPGLEGHHFVAWGAGEGLVDVGFFQVPHEPDGSSATSTAPSSWRHLVSLNLGSPGESVTHLSFGGGPHVLLAAATASKLAVFALEPLMDHVFQADSAAVTGENEAAPWELSPAVHDEPYLVGSVDCGEAGSDVSVIALSWTQQLDGVLISDSAGKLAMWELSPLGNDVPAPSSTCATLRCAWTVSAPEPQDSLSAGVAVDAPSASACTRGDKCANVWWPETGTGTATGKDANTAAQQAQQGWSSGTFLVRREKLKHPCQIWSLEWCPGVLRKDVFDTNLMAGTTSSTISTTADGSPGKGTGSGTAKGTPHPIEDHPALMTLGADGAVRVWVEMLVVHQLLVPAVPPGDGTIGGSPRGSDTGTTVAAVPPPPTLDSYFAMALVVDTPAGTAAAYTQEERKYQGRKDGRVIARWVKDTGSMLGRQRRGKASSEVLWMIIAVAPSPPAPLVVPPSSAVAAVGAVGGGIIGGGTAHNLGVDKSESSHESSLLINVAPISSTSQQGVTSPPLLNNASSSSFQVEKWTVRLYAVRGLTAVVVANLPGSMAGVSSLTSGAGGKRPQAVLWGQHEWMGSRHELLHSTYTSSSTSSTSISGTTVSTTDSAVQSAVSLFAPASFSAWMSAEDDFPKITCLDIAVRGPLLRSHAMPAALGISGSSGTTNSGYWGDVHSIAAEIAAAGITYATVLAESPTSPTTLQQRLDALTTWKGHTAAHAWNIAAMAVSPNGGIVATLDGAGGASIFDVKGGVVQLQTPVRAALSSLMYPTPPEFSFTCLEWLNPSGDRGGGVGGGASSDVDGGVFRQQQWLAVAAGRQLLALRVHRTTGEGSTSSTDSGVQVVPDISEEVDGEILGIYSLDLSSSNNSSEKGSDGGGIGAATASAALGTGLGGGVMRDPLGATTSRLSVSTTNSPLRPVPPPPSAVPVLVVLHTSTENSGGGTATTTTAGQQQSTHVTIFEVHCNPQHAQQLQLRRLGSSIVLPRTITSSISAAAPLPGTNGGMILGTAMGKVHTIIFSLSSSYYTPSTGSTTTPMVQIEELGHYVNAFSHRVPVAALAFDPDSGMVAAVSGSRTRPQLALWQLSMETESPSLSTKGSTIQKSLLAGGGGGPRLKPKRIGLGQSGCAVAWCEGLVVPCVVLGDTAGGITFFAATRDAGEGWKAVARAEGGAGAGPVVCLKAAQLGPSGGSTSSTVLAAAGPLLLSLSDGVVVDEEMKPLSRYLVETAGPLPQYHPKVLQALLLAGRHDAATAILQALSTWAPQYLQYQEQHSYQTLYCTGSDAAVALAEASTPRIASEADAAGPPAFPAVPLEQYLDPALTGLCDRLITAVKQPQPVVKSSINKPLFNGGGFGMSTTRSLSGSSGGAVASGQFDMSAFGVNALEFGAEARSAASSSSGAFGSVMLPNESLSVSGGPNASQSSGGVDTGMLDLSAFGMEMAPPPLPEPGTAPPAAAAAATRYSTQPDVSSSNVETGALDLASFGMDMGLPPAASSDTTAVDSVESGALDLSAFGMGMDFPPTAAAPPQPPQVAAPSIKQPLFGTATAMSSTTSSTDISSSTARPPLHTQSFSKATGGGALSSGAVQPVMLSIAKQAEIPPTQLCPFSAELVTALQRITGLLDSEEESKLEEEEESMDAFPYSNRRELSYLRGSGARNNSGGVAAVEMLRRCPKQPLPGLSIEETRQLLAITTFFSSNLPPISTSPVDEAGAAFLTALTLACSRPEDPREAHVLPLEASLSTGSRQLISSLSGKSSSAFGKSSLPSSSSFATATLLKKSKSMRNAAGVEYTLAPSMASASSLAGMSTDDDEENERGGAGALTLAQKWGLAPGLGLHAVLWGLMSGSPEALLGHALEKIQARDAEIAAIAQAQAEIDSETAAASGGGSGGGGMNTSAGGKGDFLGVRNLGSTSGSLTWAALRDAGAGFWLRDRSLLISTAESLAKARFAAHRNPDDAALLYAALGKKSVLQGLYRSASQTRQADFLSRDFSQPRHQQAACKNAFVLLGNHRPELAAAFFILGGSPGDAVSVCVREMGDIQLAFFIARLVNGPSSESERNLIDRYILPALEELSTSTTAGTAATGAGGVVPGHSGENVWGAAIAAWLLGDGIGCLKCLLCLPQSGDVPLDANSTIGEVESTENGRFIDPEGIVPLWNVLDLLVRAPLLLGRGTSRAMSSTATLSSSTSSTATRMYVPGIFKSTSVGTTGTGTSEISSSDSSSLAEELLRALQMRCVAASEALQSAGMPALALQAELIASKCRQSSTPGSTISKDGTASGTTSRLSSLGAGRRIAWACGAALLAQPPGSQHTPGTTMSHHLAALRAMGLEVDKIEAIRRVHSLQRAVNPQFVSTSASMASLFSPRSAALLGSSALLYRQSSMDTTRSTHSMGSGSGHRLSLDSHQLGAMHQRKGDASKSSNKPLGDIHPGSNGPLQDGVVVFQVDADSLHSVACCPLISPEVLGRPIITATHRHGILEFAAQAPPSPRPLLTDLSQHSNHAPSIHLQDSSEETNTSQSAAAGGGGVPRSPTPSSSPGPTASMFSRFLSQIFDQTSWALDPMERSPQAAASDGDVGLAVASAMTNAVSGSMGSSPRVAAAAGAGAGLLPSPRRTSLDGGHASASRYISTTFPSPQTSRALVVAAHPTRQLFLSGEESSGKVHLWQFGGPRPVAAYTPVAPKDLPAAQVDNGLFSFGFTTQRSTSVVSRLGHWGGPRGLAFSPNGERFAAVGEGGVVATWRLGGGSHRPTDADGALCAEWWHHCLTKEGRAVVYVGGGSSVVAVGGKCSLGNIAVWDAASPPAEACVGRLKHHTATVTALCTLPGGWLLAATDTAGALSLSDVRMLGGSSGGARTLWSVRASKEAVQALTKLPLAATDRPRAMAMKVASGGCGVLVTGGCDGVVRVWQASSGKLLQSLDGAVLGKGKGILSLGGGPAAVGVTGLAVCEEGLVSCGGDGTVKLFPLAT